MVIFQSAKRIINKINNCFSHFNFQIYNFAVDEYLQYKLIKCITR